MEKENVNVQNELLKSLRAQLDKAVAELNDDANRRWENDRIIEGGINLSENKDCYILDFGMGKWNPNFFTIEMGKEEEYWRVKQKSLARGGRKALEDLESLMQYVIMPIIYGH